MRWNSTTSSLSAFSPSRSGKVFFPDAEDTASSLLFTLATFGVGFATRPLGGVVIGHAWATRLGPQARHAVFLRPDGRLGGGAGADAVLCQHRHGMRRCWRCCSGCCRALRWAAKSGPATAFLLEVAPPHRRGLYVSLQNATQYLATLMAPDWWDLVACPASCRLQDVDRLRLALRALLLGAGGGAVRAGDPPAACPRPCMQTPVRVPGRNKIAAGC